MRRHAVVAALIVATVALSACANTIRGAGRDIGEAASATRDAVRSATD